ncbi:S8 family serine peptidase [Streptomyces sp. NPDC086010]|uniref:S8 family serine peptidase n=1 Tax=Streptomyces sp. NPDC086010 TaxID=3365745 RepID=UPI0037CDA2EC
MSWNRLTAAISAGLLMTIGAVPHASADTSGTDDTHTSGRGAAVAVRLLTGDRVILTPGPDGRRTAAVEPGPGRDGIVFHTQETDGSLTVLPSDAMDLVTTGTLDRTLFDVTALIAQGYDEAHTDALPLIVSDSARTGLVKATPGSRGSAATLAGRLAGMDDPKAPARRLTSIGASALHVADKDLSRFWATLAPAGIAPGARVASTPRVWLDAKVSPVLDRSTAQINAPTAWKAGYEGQGVKVAILDSGVDANHPDLAGRIADAKDFSGSSGTGDAIGHGTHVASTVAGSGAASSGTRRGVAPRADLLIGKVLDDDGYGDMSSVVSGMEWAVAEHAKIVNMSLGADMATDGHDPLSEAVDQLSASGKTLFVVAAGNTGGQGDNTVGAPGAADGALTVGAVDRDDSLAPFSSRGPRWGDGSVKPDVTAPGVNIVAARASGTTMGTPVDANYTSASGTSMATPHVAGAAALLAQQHPDWSAQQLKDTLISTARTVPGTRETEQGGGRIDLAAAVTGRLTATGTLLLGPIEAGKAGDRGPDAAVRYTNTSSTTLTLDLDLALDTAGGRAPAAGSVTLGQNRVTVPAGSTVEVPLRTDAAKAVRGDYYGYVTAKSATGAVLAHTTVALIVRAPMHSLTVRTLDSSGKPVAALPALWGADGFVGYTSLDPVVAEVQEGTYHLSTTSYEDAADGIELRQVVAPEVRVTKDVTVTLDARKTTQVRIRTPRPSEQLGVIGFQTNRQIDGHSLTQGVMYFDIAKRVYVSPTARVTDGTFEFASRWQLAAPQLRAEVPGSPLPLDPYYMPRSPVFGDKGAELTVVDAGTFDAPDFSRVRGKLAVVRDAAMDEQALVQAAADAGARAVILAVPDGMYPWTRWRPDTERVALPVMRVGTAQGAALLKRAASRSTRVRFSGTVNSPYLYDVMQIAQGKVPDKVVVNVSERNSAVVRATYSRTGKSGWGSEQRFGWRPYQESAWNQYSRFVPTGRERVEYVTAGDTLWQHRVSHTTPGDVDQPLGSGMQDTARTYRAGQHTGERWFGAVTRPSIPRGTDNPSVRDGDMLRLRIPEFADSGSGHWSRLSKSTGGIGIRANEGDSASAVLYRNGKRISAGDSAWTDVAVPAGQAEYRLEMTTSRISDAWDNATGTETAWTFRSATTAVGTPLRLLQVDFDVPVDQRNAVAAGRRHTVGLNVRVQEGLPAPAAAAVRFETSYDDGRTWTRSSVRHTGSGYAAEVERPAGVRGDAFVSLRVTAADATGARVRQTVRRAYLHPGR